LITASREVEYIASRAVSWWVFASSDEYSASSEEYIASRAVSW
jgi:hypothetical protein